MTTLQIHLIMLGLGLIAYLFLAGPISNRKSASRRLKRQWWMGVIAGIAVAASPLSRYVNEPPSGIELLSQSLVVAAICLLAILLIVLLGNPLRALKNKNKNKNKNQSAVARSPNSPLTGTSLTNNSNPIVINADSTNTGAQLTNSNNAIPAAVTVDRSLQSSMNTPSSTASVNETVVVDQNTDSRGAIIDIDALDNNKGINNKNTDNRHADDLHAHAAEDDQANIQTLSLTDIESVVNMKAKHGESLALDEKYRQTSAANDNDTASEFSISRLTADKHLGAPSVPTNDDRLDLSETEQLFAEIRQQTTTVELPDEAELRRAKADATIDVLDFDTQLIQDDKNIASVSNQLNTSNELIEEAEVVEHDDPSDETSLEFGNDLTGEYSHPAITTTPSANTSKASSDVTTKLPIPDTLDAAINAAKATAVTLQAQVSNLEESITELDDLRDATIDATIDAANISAEQRDMLLIQKDALLRSEDQARHAAESVIAAQSAMIDQGKRQQSLINSLLQSERQRLSSMQLDVERSRKMARTAANLARRAAVAQHESRGVARREQIARLKSQESTRKAVTIARNAISALAAEERKSTLTRH